MATPQTEKIRNLAVIGAGGAGKTSLVDLLLFRSGAASRRGRVEDGTSLSDHTPEEKNARHSLYLSVLSLEHEGRHVTLLDTPGYSDYVGEACLALAAVDAALMVVDASGSIPTSARRLFQAARSLGLPVFLVINKIDAEQASFDGALEAARALLGPECCAMSLPDHTGSAFSKVISLLDPASAGTLGDLRASVVESIVETDEAVMEKYLELGEIQSEELAGVFAKAVHGGAVVPAYGTSVEKDLGVAELLDAVVAYAPSPLEGAGRTAHKGKEDGEELAVKAGSSDLTCAQVFKTVSDPYVGKMSYLRVWSGTVSNEVPLTLARTGKTEKLQNLIAIQGKESTAIPSAVTGQILAVAKVESLETNDTLCSGGPIFLAPIQVPRPMVSLAIESKARGDEQKLSTAMKKLASEDLTFHVERDAVTHELVVSGITNLHLDTKLKRLKDQFGVDVNTKIPRVPLKETVMITAEGHHRHKKQTGGAGQFGEVYLRVHPNERGKGFEFIDAVVGGSIPRNFIPAVEKGIHAAMQTGVFAGYPVVDVKVEVYDGKHHPVDSNETSFRMAGAKAFKDAFLKARPCLLEPIVDLEVEIPASAMGDITGDLNSRRGRIQGMDSLGNLQIVKAQVPLREIQNYSTDLRSMTAGEGSYTFTFSHYDVVPAKLADEIRAGFKEKDEE